MVIKHLQRLSRKFAKSKLFVTYFRSSILSLTLLGTACANASSGHALLEPCSYADTITDKRDFDDAFKTCLQSAKDGNAVSQKNLGYIYYFGNKNVDRDVTESVKWFQAASQNGSLTASARLNIIEQKVQLSDMRQ